MSNLLKFGGLYALSSSSIHSSRLFALIIGINNYKPNISQATSSSYRDKEASYIDLPSFTNPRSALADAKHLYKYLTFDLGVPSEQIKLLRDEETTRAEIINAFHDLGERQDIRKGDSIVISYAGHGADADEVMYLNISCALLGMRCGGDPTAFLNSLVALSTFVRTTS
ncbi:hypothetical protein BJ912DRAFT_844185 [Pholiota molesta]|nr:hypothetical protein BJ912DRAFT_844185 [Pholiota molesta]